MRRAFSIGLVALVAAAVVPLATETPSLARLQDAGETLVQQLRRPQVKLVLQAEKQIQTVDEQGKPKLSWQALEGEATVHPGDTLRYTLASENEGEMAAKNLEITQPIPAQMKYVLKSAEGNEGVQITYSIDGGQSFVETPMVKVKMPDGTVKEQPAPAEAYTHIRWNFADSLAPAIAVNLHYDVEVK
ncbi:MAG TPA: hypothetical protein V6D29_09375 [Leptolyngbyaceae cyanobacterium]